MADALAEWAGVVAAWEKSQAVKAQLSDEETRSRAIGSCFGQQVNQVQDQMMQSEDLDSSSRIHAANSSILNSKLHRKSAQGFQEMGFFARVFNHAANTAKDMNLEIAAGDILRAS